MKASMNWNKDMHFSCHNGDIKTEIDAATDHGGNNLGPTPKELVLNAMMGCTGMDVVSILKKMRQEITNFSMDIESTNTKDHPVHFKTATICYYLAGPIDGQKAKQAVEASLTKYCGVNFMITRSCEMTFKLFLNGQQIHEGPVQFVIPSP